jgi:hypothetical protein
MKKEQATLFGYMPRIRRSRGVVRNKTDELILLKPHQHMGLLVCYGEEERETEITMDAHEFIHGVTSFDQHDAPSTHKSIL